MGKSVFAPELQEELEEVAESNQQLSPLAKALSYLGFDLAKRRDRDRRAEPDDEDERESDDDSDDDSGDERAEGEGSGDYDEDEEDEEEYVPPVPKRGRAAGPGSGRMGKSLPGLPPDVELIDETDLFAAMDQRMVAERKALAKQLAKSQAPFVDALTKLAKSVAELQGNQDAYERQPRRSTTGNGRQTRGTATVQEGDPLIGGTGNGVRYQPSPGDSLAKSNDIGGTWLVIDRSGVLLKSKDGDELSPLETRERLEQAAIDGKISPQDVIKFVCEGTLPDEVRKRAGLTV